MGTNGSQVVNGVLVIVLLNGSTGSVDPLSAVSPDPEL
jgi:hypothetical protein